MRGYLVALAVLLAFVVVAFVGIWALTRTPGGSPAVTPAPSPISQPPPEPLAPAPLPPSRADLPILARPEVAPPPLIADPPPPPPPAGSWEAVAPVARLSAMGPLGGAIGRAINLLEPQLSACFDEDSQARHGATVPSRSGDASGDEGGTPILWLEIEVGGGSARIVDAPVDSRGGASDGLLSCVQRVLRGLNVPVPWAQAGRRYRVPYSVTQ